LRHDSTVTVGIDLGDRWSQVCVLSDDGESMVEWRVATTRKALHGEFGKMAACRVALEAGTQSPWVARLLESVGHEVLIANPRKLRAIYESDSKSDRLDAQMLARLARIDPRLLAPIHPRSSVCQRHLSLIRSRARLIECRTKLVNHIRGVCKSHGYRLKKCAAKSLHRQARDQIPEELDPALVPILEVLATLEASIRNLDREIEQVFEQEHAAAVNLLTIPGVGVLTALAFVLTLENGERFRKRRAFSEEPRCGFVSWAASAARSVWAERSAVADHESGGCVSADPSGELRPLHHGSFRTGHGTTAR